MAKTLSIILLLALLVSSTSYYMPVYKRPFDVNDVSISRDYIEIDKIPMKQLIWIGLGTSFFLIFATFRNLNMEIKIEKIVYLAFLTGVMLTTAIVEFIKKAIGRLRPDFLDRCKEKNGYCTGDAVIIFNGRQSFPSGHSAFSFCLASFVSCFILDVFDKEVGDDVFTRVLSIILCVVSLFMSSYVGKTRISDNKHFLGDVIAGATFGFLCGTLSYVYARKAIYKNREFVNVQELGIE